MRNIFRKHFDLLVEVEDDTLWFEVRSSLDVYSISSIAKKINISYLKSLSRLSSYIVHIKPGNNGKMKVGIESDLAKKLIIEITKAGFRLYIHRLRIRRAFGKFDNVVYGLYSSTRLEMDKQVAAALDSKQIKLTKTVCEKMRDMLLEDTIIQMRGSIKEGIGMVSNLCEDKFWDFVFKSSENR